MLLNIMPKAKEKETPKNLVKFDDLDEDDLTIKLLKTNKSKIKINELMKQHIIPKHPSSIMLCGKSGSGKTMALLNLLTRKNMYNKYFDIIFLFSETALSGGDDLYKNHCDKSSGCHIPEKRMFKPDKSGLDQLDHILKTQKKIIKDKGIEKSPKILIIFDDIAHSRKFLASKQYLLMHIANRHFNTSSISLTQSYVKIPRSCRCQLSALMFFHGGTNTEKQRLSEEHCPSNWDEKSFLKLIDMVIKKKYNFLFINKHADTKNRYRQNLNTILEM